MKSDTTPKSTSRFEIDSHSEISKSIVWRASALEDDSRWMAKWNIEAQRRNRKIRIKGVQVCTSMTCREGIGDARSSNRYST